MSKLGTLTIGQAPRADITPILDDVLDARLARHHAGVLDGLSRAEIERAVATEPGEPVDPVQAALWGLGRTVVNEQPTLRLRLVDLDPSDDNATTWLTGIVGTPVTESEFALRQGKFLVPRLMHWARSGHLPMPRSDDYVLAPTERGAIDNLRLTEKDVPPPKA